MKDGSKKNSRPHPNETPKDWMYRHECGYWTGLNLASLTGWTKGKTQLDPFPENDSFKSRNMESCHLMVSKGWRDHDWDPLHKENIVAYE